jgi:hypothetical protein
MAKFQAIDFLCRFLRLQVKTVCIGQWMYLARAIVADREQVKWRHISTHIVFVEYPEHQGRKLGRVPLREELLVDLDEALQTDIETCCKLAIL